MRWQFKEDNALSKYNQGWEGSLLACETEEGKAQFCPISEQRNLLGLGWDMCECRHDSLGDQLMSSLF